MLFFLVVGVLCVKFGCVGLCRKKSSSTEPKLKKAKVEKKGKKGKDPNKPKRPSTAFFIFM